MACVELIHVTKAYGSTEVLSDLSLRFPRGVTTAVVGASGSGKTTLLRLINALEPIDGGELLVNGQPPPTTSLEAFRRGMGYAVQGAGLLPHLSVLANTTLVARLEGWSAERIELRARALFERMRLDEDLWRRYPAQLSGGQQQRVGLCRALMLAPELLLLDEPFSAIDPITRTDLHHHFVDLQKLEKVSTVLVTHDMREAVKLSEYLVILAEGKLAQAGPTKEVIVNPASGYVERLLADQLG